LLRLGECQKNGLAEAAVKEGKGDPAWFNVAFVAPKYHVIKQNEPPSILHWWIEE
jgi:hypothetical protein